MVTAEVGKPKRSPKRQGDGGFIKRPDENAFRQREDVERCHLNEIQKKVTKINELIQEKRGGKTEYESRRSEIRHRLDEINEKIQVLEQERAGMMSRSREAQDKLQQKRQAAVAMKKTLPAESVADIDDKIREMEKYYKGASLSLAEEKKLVTKMQQLRKMKPAVREYHELEQDLQKDQSRAAVATDKARLTDIIKELEALRARRQRENDQLKALSQDRQKAAEPVRELVDQREELKQQANVHHKNLNAIKQEYTKAMEQFNLQKLQHRRAAAEQERIVHIQERKEKLMLDLEELQTTEPFVEGLVLLEQIMTYVKKLVNEYKAETDEVKPATENAAVAVVNADPSERMLVPKNQRAEDHLVAPRMRKGKRSQKRVSPAKKYDGVISHDVHTIANFAHIGINPPLHYADAASCLEALEEKMAEKAEVRKEKIAQGQVHIDKVKADIAKLDAEEKECLKTAERVITSPPPEAAEGAENSA